MNGRLKSNNTFIQEKYDIDKEIESLSAIIDDEERDPFIITFYINSKRVIFGFTAKGATGFTNYGLDIIAAAISALTVNTVHSIKHFTEDDADVEVTKNYVKCVINGRISKEAAILFKSLKLGMYSVQNSYGEQYITIEEVKLEKNKRFFGLIG
ncbi:MULTISPECIES: ribosomal-processing cysteine protease Prp [unclassified Paenibacillus]|uniref:ribosomal-processing cysteine protease Prp n=1 Tax=unclassified Paenibacillus TaxID=185978 RepID=UPI00363E9300